LCVVCSTVEWNCYFYLIALCYLGDAL